MSRSPFPLQWPDGLKRNTARYSSAFDKARGFNKARDGVLSELRKMSGVSHVVITSNLPTNGKGLPHSGSSGRIEDPGIAIWWVKSGKEQVMACDRYPTCVENMHALELTIAALRGIARWGSTEMVESAFAGFAALPSGVKTKRTWREVLGESGSWPVADRVTLLTLAKRRYYALMKLRHPDVGGTTEAAAELTNAYEEAVKELDPS